MQLGHPNNLHLRAAEGWLELGNYWEAHEELDRITSPMQTHPLVLRVRWDAYAKAEQWDMAIEIARFMSQLLPDNSWGFVQFAFGLNELKLTQEAKDVLLRVAAKFPSDIILHYNLACYCCQLGDLTDAWRWLTRAIDLGGVQDIRRLALDDPDLQPLWPRIAEI